MDQGLQKGYLFCSIRGILEEKQWQKRYYVLYGSATGNQARLDFYDNEHNYRQRASVHGTLYIGDVDKIQACKMKEKSHTFELVLKSGKVRTFAAESAKDLTRWLHCLRAEKAGNANAEKSLRIPSGMISLHGSQNSLDRDESPAFDENLLYESAENPDIFEVETIESPASKKNKLVGAYNLRVNTLNMTLCDPSSARSILIWPYRYIRRYGRSKTTFTFEAGRKCSSGEGYFTFKVENGDAMFSSVQKRTNEMKKKVSTSTSPPGSASSEDASPALPARQYIPECEVSGDSVTNRVKMFENTKPSKPEIKQKPPMLQKLSSRPPITAPKPSLDLVDSSSDRYELAKTVYPVSPKGKRTPSPPYEDSDRAKTVDATYREAASTNGTDKGPGSPVYAVYDVARSSRLHVYDDPADPYYDCAVSVNSFATTTSTTSFEYAEPYLPTSGEAWRKHGHKTDNIHEEHYEETGNMLRGDIEADGVAIYEEPDERLNLTTPQQQGPSKISEISSRLKNQTLDSNSNSEYDRIDVHKTLPAGRSPRAPLPAVPGNSEYGHLSPPRGRKLFKNKKK